MSTHRYDEDIAWWRAYADRARAEEGSAAYARALRELHRLQDMRDADNAPRPRRPVTGGTVLFWCVAVMGLIWWVFSDVRRTALALVLVAAFVWWYARRQLRPRDPVEGVVLPPLASSAAPAAADPVNALDAVQEAVIDALPSAKGRIYRDAAVAGRVGRTQAVRDESTGTVRYAVPLPGGAVLPGQVNLEALAQAMGEDPRCVRPGPTRLGHLVVDVLDVAPEDRPVPPWPGLRQLAAWSDPLPLGVDVEGRPVTIGMGGRRVLIVGQSGCGKSTVMRMVVLRALADPTARVDLIDCKRSPLLRAFRDRVDYFHAGDPGREVLARLRSVAADMRGRYERMDAGVDVIADEGRRVVVIDEAHALPADCRDVVDEIARMGREAGIGLVVGTQSAATADLSSTLLGMFDVKVIMRLTASWAVSMVATDGKLPVSALPNGHAYVDDAAVAGGPVRVATYYVDDAQSTAHVDAMGRERPAVEADAPDVLEDVSAIIGDRSGVSWSELEVTLDMDREKLRGVLAARGVRSGTVRVPGGGTVRGVTRAAVDAAGGP